MAIIRFEWDEAKNATNQRKRGISFEEATQVFKDPLFLLIEDHEVDSEQRWHALGTTADALILAVVHTTAEGLEDGTWIEVIRIISARQASRKERKTYEEQHG